KGAASSPRPGFRPVLVILNILAIRIYAFPRARRTWILWNQILWDRISDPVSRVEDPRPQQKKARQLRRAPVPTSFRHPEDSSHQDPMHFLAPGAPGLVGPDFVGPRSCGTGSLTRSRGSKTRVHNKKKARQLRRAPVPTSFRHPEDSSHQDLCISSRQAHMDFVGPGSCGTGSLT